ncbi:MAG: glycosyltransferase [Thermoplasmata archaeon]|nr:glycosyltransferase [Thermoplasmata archaeon]
MDIAFFSESYLPTRDGVSSEVSSLARSLTHLGHSVRVYTPQPVHGVGPEEVLVDGITVCRVRSVPVPYYAEYRWALFPFGQLRRDPFLRAADVVHLHTPGMMGGVGFLAARHWRKPLIGTFHTNVGQMEESFAGSWAVRLFLKIAWIWTLGTYWRCDLTTAPTPAARETLETHARKPFRRPVEVVPNGIDLERFHPGLTVPDWRSRCGLTEGPLAVYLGRLTADKGIHRFLDAVAALPPEPEFGAIVAGSGPEEGAVLRRLRSDARLARRVRYVGPVAEEEKPALLSQASLFVLPSTADTSSVALLEAMASGAACVASNSGGPADLITDGRNGRLFDVRRDGALPSLMAELLTDAGERQRLSIAAGEYAREHASIEVSARRFISLYELLLTERRPGGIGHPG